MELFDRQTVEAQNGRLDIQPKHVAVFFPGGGTLALQTDVAIPGPIRSQITRLTMAVLEVSNAIDKIGKDRNLSPTGQLAQRRMTETERLKVVKALDGAGRYADDLSALAKVAEETLYQAPPLAPDDAAGALADQEIRTYYRNLSGEALTKPLEALQQGKNPRHLLALHRSPVALPGPIAQIVEGVWESYLETEKAQQFQTVNDDRAVAAWAVGAVAQLRTQLDRLAFHDPAGALQAA